jgi:hypothetical protein
MRLKSCFRWLFLLGLLFLPFHVAMADEDAADYRHAASLGFIVSDATYANFETPVYELEKGLDNLLISTDIDRAPQAVVRSYARFRNTKTGRWTRYQEFECEYHFANVEPVSAYQMLFIVRDDSKGRTAIRRFTAQGRLMGTEMMEAFQERTIPVVSERAWPKPPVVSRTDWKARPPKGSYKAQTPTRIVLHHSWQPSQAQYSGAATIRGIQNYHMDDPKTGWSDIGYHFLIGHDGVIYQGRPETGVGAHCPPNTNMIGICVIGDYDPGKDPLNSKIETSLINLLSHLSAKYSIDPKAHYYGHCDFSSKSCPGDTIYKKLPDYREQVIKNIGQKK